MQLLKSQIKVLIFSQNQDELSFLTLNTENITYFEQVKGIQKQLRSQSASVIFIHITNQDSEKAAKSIAKYVRQSLADSKARLVILNPEEYPVNELEFIENLQIDEFIKIGEKENNLANVRINRIINSTQTQDEILTQQAAQTELLMSVNRFTRHRQSIQSLILECAEALGAFCCASSAIVALSSKVIPVQINAEQKLLTDEELTQLKNNGFNAVIEQSFSRTSPNIDLLTNATLNDQLNTLCGEPIGSYLVFPLTAYSKTLAVIFCFIADSNMHRVSTQHVNVMRDTAEQLRLVIERRSAESKLKSQYARLKSALSELQSTQDQLVHAEKMASVGQMAAGIAHEINNPLASVLSNFDPLSDYVVTLVKMLDLHDSLMQSIDQPEELENHEAHQNLQSFKQESDLDFVVDDIKAIVNDSREGLLRVRDIISDLSCFSHKQELEKRPFSIHDLFDETLRLLMPEIATDIQVTHTVSVEESLNAHRGFIQQILTNLIKNASHALSENDQKSASKTINIQAERHENEVVISVQDNGPGISSELKKQIFSPFFTTKEVGQGTGLGLSVSYSLAKKMDGSLSLESGKNDTTKFVLRLPFSEE
ncbi:GHKL domain-containing protein [Alteromonadaceae bacterium M269]|nr:GHKL domain-containing protein [Alteromonadaceae bacterium M269]